VLPLDADDRIEPRMLERCVDELRPRTGLGFVYTDIRFFDQRRGVHRQLPYNFHDELYRNQVTVCALIRREAWQDVGGYREEMLRGAEDWEFWIALGEKGWFGRRIPEPLFHYRVRKGQMSDGTREVLPEIAAEIRAMHPALYSEENLVRLRRRWKGRFNPRDPEGWLFRGKRRLHRWFGREGGD